jgi:hypothetical protein
MATRYQRDNQEPQVEGGETIQWPQDTKGITRSRAMVDFLILVLMQELSTLPEHLHSPLCFSRVGVHHYLVLCSALHTIVSVFVL